MRAILIFQRKRSLKAGLVVGVDNARNTFADQGTGYRIELDLVGIRYLLNADDNFQDLQLPSTSETRRK